MRRRPVLLVFLLPVAAALGLGAVPRAATPLPAGHYGGPVTATWSVSSSPRWLRTAALKVLELREGIDDLPASGSCDGVVGIDVPGDGAAITGLARCEFPGELSRYDDRVVTLEARESGDRLEGTARCCGVPEVVTWSARRVGATGLAGTAGGSSEATAVSVETRFGVVEVSLRVDWTVRFAARRAE